MFWQNRVGIADTAIDLRLSEVLHMLQARTTEVRVCQNGVGKICVVEKGFA